MRSALVRVVVVLVIFLATVTIISRLADFQAIIRLTSQTAWGYLLAALVAQFFYLLFQAQLMRSLFLLADQSLMLVELMVMSVTSQFINVVVPTLGLSGLTVFTAEARRRTIEFSTTLTIAGLAYYLNYLSFALIFGLSLALLITHQQVSQIFVFPSFGLGLIIILLTIVLMIANQNPRRLTKVFVWISRLIKWLLKTIGRRRFLTDQKVESLSEGVHETVNEIFERRLSLWRPFFWSLGVHVANILTLALVFLALNAPVGLGTILSGYVISYLVTVVSITPAGVGFVEGAMVLVFRSLGLPLELSILATTLYRAIVFWFPFVLGLMAFRLLKIVNDFS